MFHRIDSWEEIDNAWKFWRLVLLLPCYNGAVKTGLQLIREARQKDPARPQEYQPSRDQFNSIPIPNAKPGEVVKEVPLEFFNGIVGEQMISFGKG